MDIQKYRKLYLSNNWDQNKFDMITYGVEFNKIWKRNNKNLTIDLQKNHSLVL